MAPTSPPEAGAARPPLGRVLVIVPTFNEALNLERTAEGIRTVLPEADVLVADDNSPDGTGELADKIAATDSHVHVLHRPGKEGLGAAYLAGFAWALERDYGVVVEMDADGSHRPEDLPRLVGALADADLALGSRWVAGGQVVNWPRHRLLLSRGGNTYARLALSVDIQDITGGFRAFRRATLERLDLGDVSSQGYCFQVDLAWRVARAGMQVVEVPITFVERQYGTSKMSGSIVSEALWRVTRWGVDSRLAKLRRPR
jgi:dolichol-phosphate mannosyltransferase